MLKPLLHRLALPVSLLTLVLAFALSGAVGHAETPANDGTITPLRTREGAIQHVAIATSGKDARYSVEITAGEQVALKTTNSAFSGQYVIRWRKPAGAVLYQETWAPNENWFWPSKTFTEAGTYTLEVDPVGPATGSVDLHIWDTTSPGGLTLATSGEESSKTFAVEAPTEVVDIHLSGTAGERILLQGSEADFVGSFHLVAPDGSTVPGSEAGGNLNETRRPFELPETGEYTIELYGDGMETGSVKLTASAQNEVLSGQITPSRSPEGAVQHVAVWTPGRDAQFSVDVSAGEYVSLKAVNSTFNGGYTIRWYDPSGTFLQSLSSGGFEDAYVVPRRFDEAGTYTLEVDPGGTAIGSLDLKVWDATSPDDLTLATSGEESSKTFAVEVPGEVAKVRFRGIRGQEIHLDATESSFAGQLTVRNPHPGQVAYGSLSTSSDLHLDFALPESGAYTVWLYANSDHTGSVRLTASTDESDELTGQISPTPTGTEQHVEFDSAEQFAHYTVSVEAGEWVSMVSDETELGTAYRVEWLKPSGELLQRFNQRGDRDYFFERVHFDETGDATLVVMPEDGAGSVDLTVYDASDRIAQIAAGEAQTFTLTAPRQQYLIEIDGTEGEQLEIIPSGADFVGFFHLQTPAGEFLPGSTGNTMTDYWSMNLPETGTYTLVLAGNGAQTGSVTLEPVEVREDEDLTGTITPLATPEGALQHVAIVYSHQNARYSVEMTAGERVALKPTNSTFGGAYGIRWKNADGQTLYHARWNGDEERFWPPKTFDEAGTYTLELDPDGSVRGSTDLRLWDSSSPDGLTLDTSGEGSSKVFDVNVPGQRLNIDLTGNAGERLSIRGSDTELEGEFHVLAPDGSFVTNAEGGLTERHGPFELPETGTYTVVVTPVGEQTGSLRLTVRDGGGFEVIPGTIEPTTAGAEQHVEFSGPDQVAHYTVPVTPGEWVSIVAGATALDPGYRLEWLAPDGRSMQTWYPSAEGGFFEPVYFSESGDATLVVAPENGAIGSVDLTLYDASDQTGQIVPGESATFGVAAPGQRSLIEIPGAEDHQLSIIPSGADFEGELHLRTPSGEVLEGVGGDLSGPLGPVYLSEKGTYMIILTGTGAQTGSVTLEAVETDGETGELDGSITPLATAEGALQHVAISSFGRRARYSVEITEGEKVALKTTESAFDGGYYIRWLDPSGNVVNSERWNGTENWFWAPQTFTAGTYTLVVDPEGTATGSVDLRLWEDPTLTGQELELSHAGDSVTSTIDIPGQAEAITFAGEAGRSVQITTSESSFEEGEVTLIAPVGYAVQSASIPGAIEAQLPEDGTYTVLVEGTRESTGSVLVELLDQSVEDITGDIVPTTSGTEQHVEFPSLGQVAHYTVPVTSGESVSIISGATELGASYRLEWLTPAGETLQSWDTSGESGRFFEAVRFDEGGDATLVVEPEAGTTGLVDLTLYDASDLTDQIAVGESSTYSIDAPGQRHLIEFEGTEGERLRVVPSEADFEGEFHVETPVGEPIEGSGGDLTAVHGPVTLPETGTYAIVLTGDGAETGSVKLEAKNRSMPVHPGVPVALLSFDEDEGAVAHDSVGHHSGVIHGANWTRNGKFGSALNFTGNSVVTVPDSAALDFTEGFTLEAWVWPRSVGGGAPPVILKEDPKGGEPSYSLTAAYGSDGPAGFVTGSQGQSSVVDPAILPAETWSHLALVSDGEEMRLYVDGEPIQSGPSRAPKESHGPVQIGEDLRGYRYDGKIDEVRIYGSELTAAEIKENLTSPIGPPSYPQPVAAFSFDESRGDYARDSISHHDGSIHGAGWTADGKYGSALQFDGEEDRVTVPDSAALDFTEGFTLEAWVRPDAAHAWSPLFTKEDEGATPPYGYRLYAEGGSGVPAFGVAHDGSSSGQVTGTEPLPVGSWSYVTVTSDGEEMRLYVDGKLEESGPAVAVKPTDGPLQIGGDEVLGQHFAGRIDEVRLYDSVLGDEEIAEDRDGSVLEGFDVTIEGAAGRGEELVAVPGVWPGPRPDEYTYRWLRCDYGGGKCEEIAAAVQRKYAPRPADLGHELRVELTTGPDPVMSVRSGPTDPVGEKVTRPYIERRPLILGRPVKGHSLRAWLDSVRPESATLDFDWRRCDASGESCQDIAGAEGEKYVATSADVGSTLRVLVAATNIAGSDSLESTASEIVEAAGLENLVPPAVSEVATASGTALTAGPGDWSGPGQISYRYQWQRCGGEGDACRSIEGGIGRSYRPTHADVGSTIRVRVSASNGSSAEVANSAATAEVVAVSPSNANLPAIEGRTRQGDTLGVSSGTWSGLGDLQFSFGWLRCDAFGEACEVLPTHDEELTLSGAEVGHTIRARVEAENEAGTATVETAPSAVIAGESEPGPEPTSPPTVNGGTVVGEELTATTGIWSGASEFGYQWMSCETPAAAACELIPGATEADYTSVGRDDGYFIGVEVTARAQGGAESEAFAFSGQTVHKASAPTNESAPAIVGSTMVGGSLEAGTGSWSKAPTSYRYRWQRCEAGGCRDIDGAAGQSYSPTASDDGRTVRVLVTAVGSGGRTTAASGESGIVGSEAPVAETAPILSGEARVGSSLTATHGTWDGDAPIAYGYQWKRCDDAGAGCIDIVGADATTYELTPADAGAALRVLVIATNGHGEGQTVSDASAPVSAADSPALTSPPNVTGTAEVAQTLKADHGSWQGAEGYGYRWQRCSAAPAAIKCVNIEGATGSSYVLTPADVGSALRVEVVATGTGGDAAALSVRTRAVEASLNPGEQEDSIKNTDPPRLKGKAEEGQTLSVEDGIWSSYLPLTFTHQWRRCDASGSHCADIKGATQSTYTPGEADRGATLRAFVTASNSRRGRVVQTDPTQPIQQASPTASAPPTVEASEGEFVDGESLRVEPGVWQGGGLSFEYRWQVCDAEGHACQDLVEGGTSDQYVVRSTQVGSTLRVVETAGNKTGSMSATSDPTPVIGARAPSEDEPPMIFGEAVQDGLFVAYPGAWWGTPEIEFAYQWQRCDEEGDACEDIGGADEVTYIATALDVGARIRVEVTAENAGGSSSAFSEAGEIVGPAVLPVDEGALPEIRGPLFDGRELTAEPGEWVGNQPIEFAYQWQRCDQGGGECAAIGGADEAGYVPNVADIGAKIRVKVTASNSSGSGSALSDVVGPIEAAAPSVASPPTIWGPARQGEAIEVEPGEWLGSGPLDFAYQWQRCDGESAGCVDIQDATGRSYTPTAAVARHFLRVVVTAQGRLGTEATASEARRVLPSRSEPDLPPTISGEAVNGHTLRAAPGKWIPEPDHFRYEWQRCSNTGTNCYGLGQGSREYILGGGDVSHQMKVRVRAENDGEAEYEVPSEVSSVTAVVGPRYPMVYSPPTIGAAQPVVGTVMTANEGVWLGEAPISYSIGWQVCAGTEPSSCYNVATGRSYTPSSENLGRRLRVKVYASNANGSELAYSAISNPVAKAAPHTPINLRAPRAIGHPFVGDELQADEGSWTGDPSFAYEWRRCDKAGESCTGISGAAGRTYVLAPADLGHSIRLKVTASAVGGDAVALGAPTAEIAAATRPEVEGSPRVEGEPKIGAGLLASAGEWSGSPEIDFDYSWRRCDAAGRHCVAISGEAEQTYRPTRLDAGHSLRVQVTATNGAGATSATSKPTAAVPAAESIAEIEPPVLFAWGSRPSFGFPYRAGSTGKWKGEPKLAYQWERCDPLTEQNGGAIGCVSIPGATDPLHYVPTRSDVGFKLRLAEVATAPGEEISVLSNTSPEIVAGSSAGKSSYSGALVPGSSITAKGAVASEAGLPITLQYHFLRLRGTTPESLQDGPSAEYELGQADLGHAIEIEITASIKRADGASTVETRQVEVTTAKVEVAATDDVLPAISGEPFNGATLTATKGAWHGGGGPLEFSYQWRRCDQEGKSCAPIPGATAAAYTLGTEDVASTIRVAVRAGVGSSGTTAESEKTAVVGAATSPAAEKAPSISGELVELDTVEAAPGAWTGSGPITFHYQWQACASESSESCLDIEEATESKLNLDRREVGRRLRIVVTASSPGGRSTSRSNLVGPVTAAPAPRLLAPPSLTVLGPPVVGSTLTTDGGSWENSDPTELKFRWFRCDEDGSGCELIEWADRRTYMAELEDVGSTLRVEVVASDSSAEISATSEASPEIEAASGSLVKKMVFVGQGRDDIRVADEEGEGEEQVARCKSILGEEGCSLYSPQISPNGMMIAVGVIRGGLIPEDSIYVMNFDGSNPRKVARGTEPQWSPDGTRLYFSATPVGGGSPGLFVVDADGTDLNQPTVVPGPSGGARGPAVSPDGSMLAYAGYEAGEQSSGIYIANLDGSGTRRLGLGPKILNASHPVFTPDGESVIFDALSPEHIQYGPERLDLQGLWEAGIDGSGLHRLTPDDSSTYDAPSVRGDEVVSSKREVSLILYNAGFSVHESESQLVRVKTEEGEATKPLKNHGFEPDWITDPKDLLLKAEYVCFPSGTDIIGFAPDPGYYPIRATVSVDCSAKARNVRAYLAVTGGYVEPPKVFGMDLGMKFPIQAASASPKHCGDGGPAFICSITARTASKPGPPCEEIWYGKIDLVVGIEWSSRAGKRRHETFEAEDPIKVVARCEEEEE